MLGIGWGGDIRLGVEICMGMENVEFLSLLWDSHGIPMGIEIKLFKLMGRG